MEKDNSLDTDIDVSSADEATRVETNTASRSKKKQVKVPKKINKARREKLKREQLNDLFLDLAKSLDVKEPNNGKASILTEAARFLNGMFVHVDRLRKENKTLTSEYQYITVEKEELKEDNSFILSEVVKLRGEIELQSQQNQIQLPSCPLLVFPCSSNDPNPNLDRPPANQTSVVSKPCPRYPDQLGSWQSQNLEQQLRADKTN